MLNVGERNIFAARRIRREAPAMAEKVEKGEITIHAALRKLSRAKTPKPKREKPMPEPKNLRVIYDSDDQIAEQICTLCNRLAEVAEKVSPEGIWPKIAGNVRFANNVNRSLSAATHFLDDLHALWASPDFSQQ